MSPDIQTCTPDTPIPEVARMMLAGDCGAIPVVNAHRHPVGLITDRDITLRAVAKNQDPLPLTAADCMSRPAATIRADADLRDALRLMERKQLRRLPVTDDSGACCGILAQADIARVAPTPDTAEFLKDLSRPHRYPS
jgi:CBS domain-containing protein